MSAVTAAELSLEETARKTRRRKLVVTVILISLGVHIAAGIIAGAVIVARYFAAPPAEFKATRDIRVAAQEREHKMNMASFDGAAPQPVFNDRLQSIRPTAFALPQLPKLPLDQMVPLDPSSMVTDAIPTSFGAGGLGTGSGPGSGSGSGGTGGLGAGIKFLGVQTTAKRIVIMYDVASAGMSMENIRDETARLIDGLGVNVRFGLVEYVRSFAVFRNELIPANDENRAAARTWLNQYFSTSGTLPRSVPNTVTGSLGFLVALEQVFKQQPDVVFVISDANMQRGSGFGQTITPAEIGDTLQRLQATLPVPAKIYFIGVGVEPETEKEMKRVITRHGGGGLYSRLKK